MSRKRGQRPRPSRDPRPGFRWQRCGTCHSSGEILGRWTTEIGGKWIRCVTCFGTGWVEATKEVRKGEPRRRPPPSVSLEELLEDIDTTLPDRKNKAPPPRPSPEKKDSRPPSRPWPKRPPATPQSGQPRHGRGPRRFWWWLLLSFLAVTPLALWLAANGNGLRPIISAISSTEPTATAVPVTATSEATPEPTATATATPTATPTSTPTPPHLRHLGHKQQMLDLINVVRKGEGLPTVVLGDNPAAQLHADSNLENCVSSHWGLDGLKPYARYSQTGGYQHNSENVSGLDYCYTIADRVSATTVKSEIREAMDGFMESEGHRNNILYPSHRKVNIGVAFDLYNIVVVQHFEGNYTEYDALPALENGVLTLRGRLKNGASLPDQESLGVQVFYDPPPRRLTRGQLSRTYCYDSGTPVAYLRAPLTGRTVYTDDEAAVQQPPCPDPYEIPADAPAPISEAEAHAFWTAAYEASQRTNPVKIVVPWVTARVWGVTTDAFAVSADLGQVVKAFGDGVYTVRLWAEVDGARTIVSAYSIFVRG